MKILTMYETADGELWRKERDAIAHEELLAEAKRLKKLVHATDDSTSFANGDGYYQITKEEYDKFVFGFGALLEKHEPSLCKTFKEFPKSGYVGRYLSDSHQNVLYHLWSTFLRIDGELRLWGQPYYANNPSEGKEKRLN